MLKNMKELPNSQNILVTPAPADTVNLQKVRTKKTSNLAMKLSLIIYFILESCVT